MSTRRFQTKPVGYLQLIRQNVDFRNLWLGQVVSLLGDWFNLIASATLIASLTGSGLAIGGLFVIRAIAQFVMGPVGGLLADRYNRKSILILTDILRGIVVLGFLFISEPEDVWLLYILTALQLGISGMFQPTKDAILPDIVSQNELGTANALSATTWSTMLALGAALGGLVAGKWGLKPAFSIDSLSYLLSAFLIWRVRYSQTTKIAQGKLTAAQISEQYFAGFRYLRRHPDIFLIAIQKATQMLAVSSVFQIIQVELSSKVFVLGEGGSTSLGLLYAFTGIGTGVSPLLARLYTGDNEKRLRLAIAVGYLFTAVGLLIIVTLANFGIVLFGTFLRGFGVAIVWVFSTTLLLQKLPNEVRGRVFGSEYALFTLMGAIGAPVGGWMLDNVKNSVPLLLWGMTAVLLALGILWTVQGVMGTK